jgi:hypothetical protein
LLRLVGGTGETQMLNVVPQLVEVLDSEGVKVLADFLKLSFNQAIIQVFLGFSRRRLRNFSTMRKRPVFALSEEVVCMIS